MKIKKFTKKKNNEYKIILSDNTSLSFYDDTIVKYNLLSNKDIDDKTLKEIIKYNDAQGAYYKALNYIKIKLRTKDEIKKKLKTLNYSNQVINEAIEKLEFQGYLNDLLYIKSYINDQIHLSLKGPKKIIYELEKLGFNKEQIIEYIPIDIWEERIEKIIAKKIKSNHNYSEMKLKQKLKGDLITLGYEIDLITQGINSINSISEDDILEKEYNKEYKKLSKKYNGEELNNKIKYNLYKKGFSFDNITKFIPKK